MTDKDLIEIKSLQIDLGDDNSVKLVDQTLHELKNKGYDRVTIEIKTSTEQELNKSDLDIEVFKKIKKVQDLPDWVVINLMMAVGKLKESNFKLRLLNE
ncbi:MAG: hypothetical protein WBQ32_14715 [Ignavibacteriaceae bacterium]